jgi:threonine aldolase
MRALQDCNHGVQTAYGADEHTARLDSAYSDFFERQAFVFPVATGTAGNGLALGAVTPPYGTIFCHEAAHIVTTEAGAPEFYSGGARMTLLPGEHRKFSAATLEAALDAHGIGNVHHMAASAISVTQATEAGVVYELAEVRQLTDLARRHGLKVHLDGARFANAMVHLGASAADMTWKAGVDILTFGTTKNGTMNAEAVITFDPDLAKVVRIMHKRAGHLFSKMRYMSVQLLSYIEGDLWRYNATRANENAARAVAALSRCPGVKILHPPHINEVFASLPPSLVAHLQSSGLNLRPWKAKADGNAHRIVMSYCELEEQIQLLERACRIA